MALVAVSAFFVERGIPITAVVVDHGLQAGSAQIARRAAEQAASLGVPTDVVEVHVDRDSPHGLEAAARSARYASLTGRVSGATVWTAHTLDDQAESVLLGLGRGSGPRSIAGMRRFSDRVERPFLSLRRRQTEQLCRHFGLCWWDDPHNTDSRFRRVRVRTELLPLMEDVLDGGVAEALARTAELVREDADALDEIAGRECAGEDDLRDLETFAHLPRAIRSRVWRRLAIASGALAGELSHVHTGALDSLLDGAGGRRIELPGGITAVRDGDRVRFEPTR